MSLRKKTAEFLKKVKVSEVAQKTGISESTLYRVQKGENFSIDLLDTILEHYKNVNPNWFFKNKGSMFLNSHYLENSNLLNAAEPETPFEQIESIPFEEIQKEILTEGGTLEKMQYDIEQLKREVSTLKMIIHQLKGKDTDTE